MAAVGSVMVGLLAWAVPHFSPSPSPRPSPPITSGLPTYSPTPTPSPDPVPTTSSPSTDPAQPSGPPAGCQQAIADINTYYSSVGTTWITASNAAYRAAEEIQQVYFATTSGAVSVTLSYLYTDFADLHNYAVQEDSTDYNAEAAKLRADVQTLDTECGTG